MAGRRRYYSLASLLDAQPRGLVRDSRHRLMWDQFMSSERLQRLRIPGRCYRLLDRATVLPENMKSFCRTWGLPDDPFFPLFLAVKKAWLAEMRIRQEKRRTGILSTMEKLPPGRRRILDELAELEKSLNSRARRPVWDTIVLPKTLKKARLMSGFEENDWVDLWRAFLESLTLHYPGFTGPEALRVEAFLVLGMDIRPWGETPAAADVKEAFRRLSKIHHPDRGGSPPVFRRLKTARDLLLSDHTRER